MIFIDTDVFLDVALEREPYFIASRKLIASGKNTNTRLGISSGTCLNLYYLVQKFKDDRHAVTFIKTVLAYAKLFPIEYQHVMGAMDSDFKDKEDAIQYFVAKTNKAKALITRNKKDYAKAKIPIFTPDEFLSQNN